MNKKIAPIILTLILLFSSCTSSPAPVVAYKTLDSIALTVDNIMQAAGTFYRAGKINDTQRDEIIKIYEVYRTVAKSTNSLIKAWAQVSPNAIDTPPEVQKAITDLNQKASDVLTITKLYGVK